MFLKILLNFLKNRENFFQNFINFFYKIWSDFMEIVPRLTKGYEALDIFNEDECVLFFKLMVATSHVLKGEKCHCGKLSKERITILLAVNLDGIEKLPL